MDDFDTPNRRPGYCPECGQNTITIGNRHECSFCNWAGNVPSYHKVFNVPAINHVHARSPRELLGCRVTR